MEVYREQFGSWADVQREFEMDVPEPDDVIYAEYNTPSYEGYANEVKGHFLTFAYLKYGKVQFHVALCMSIC